MTVLELIKELERFDEDAEVLFAYKYGDYWKTTVAEEITEAERETVEWSDYHEMWRMPYEVSYLDEPSQDDEEPEEVKTREVVVIR